MTTIFYFNPETDYALASNLPAYTAPPKVVEVRHKFAVCQIPCACPGDIILLDSPELVEHYSSAGEDSAITLISISDCGELVDKLIANPESYRIQPWGWNPAVKRLFSKSGFPQSLLPSDDTIANIRRLSHRRTTISFNRILNEYLINDGFNPSHTAPLPLEFSDTDNAVEYLSQNPDSFIKAPWSSSGRGVIYSGKMAPSKVKEWVSGIIRRQGSIMIEKASKKLIDFATEWYIENGEAEFLGLSLFRASEEGKYGKNMNLSQKEIWNAIQSVAPDFDMKFVNLQKKALENTVSDYNGFAGIDMLADKYGNIRGCIEINLRMTMGIISLYKTSI